MLDLTKEDIKDLTEGIRKRPEHKFKTLPKLSDDEKLVDHIVSNNGSIDIRSTAKEYGKSSNEVIDVLKQLGYYI